MFCSTTIMCKLRSQFLRMLYQYDSLSWPSEGNGTYWQNCKQAIEVLLANEQEILLINQPLVIGHLLAVLKRDCDSIFSLCSQFLLFGRGKTDAVMLILFEK